MKSDDIYFHLPISDIENVAVQIQKVKPLSSVEKKKVFFNGVQLLTRLASSIYFRNLFIFCMILHFIF